MSTAPRPSHRHGDAVRVPGWSTATIAAHRAGEGRKASESEERGPKKKESQTTDLIYFERSGIGNKKYAPETQISMIFVDFRQFADFTDFGPVCANSDKGPAPPPAARGRAPAALARGFREGVGAYFFPSENMHLKRRISMTFVDFRKFQ